MPTTNQEWISLIGAIGAIATPILLSLLAGIGWIIQRRVEKSQNLAQELRLRTQKLEEALRDDRLKVYNEILEPFIILLTKDEGLANDRNFRNKTKQQVIQEKTTSLSYRQTAFKMSLFASDAVVKAYNELMQFFYSNATRQNQDDKIENRKTSYSMLNLFGGLLLEIRKSVGNEDTKLTNLEMIEWLINDIRQLQGEFETQQKK